MPLTNYVTLGRSGLRVSPFCLGTMTFGEDWGWGSTVAESEAILARFIERGGNFIDTANVYTRGHSEKIIGDLVGARPRATRSAWSSRPSSSATCIPATRTAAAPAARPSSPRASSRCGGCGPTTSISTGCTPGIKFTPIEETMRALDDLVRAGKVRYIGFSDTPAWKVAQAQLLAQMRGWTPLVALQIEYSLIERTVEGELAADGARARARRHAVVAAARRCPVREVHAGQRRAP